MTRDDDTITLKDAAAHYHYTVSTLRAEAARGRLTIYRIGRRDYTTPGDIKAMVAACRVENPRRASTSIRDESSGSFATVPNSSALAALSESVNRLKSSSQNTSRRSINRKQAVTQ